MPRLIVNPNTDSAWEIILKPGANTVGSTADNDVPIEHPSVSARHCQIEVKANCSMIHDLGSATGTVVNETLVEGSPLVPGQIIQVGEVLMQFELEAHEQSVETTQAPRCKFHRNELARYQCSRCRGAFCELCVMVTANAGEQRLCRACGEPCERLSTKLLPAQDPERSFLSTLPSAFSYPLRGDGWIVLTAGMVTLAVAGVLTIVPFAALILSIFVTAYLILFMQSILRSSATGESTMPTWPEFTGFEDVFHPLLQFLGTALVSFCPALAVRWFVGAETPYYTPLLIAGLAWGCLYFPMAFTAVTLLDSLSGLNPVLVGYSIVRIAGPYLLAVALLVTVVTLSGFGKPLLASLIPVPILPQLLIQFLSLYLLAFEMRVLGLLYWTNRKGLGWFTR